MYKKLTEFLFFFAILACLRDRRGFYEQRAVQRVARDDCVVGRHQSQFNRKFACWEEKTHSENQKKKEEKEKKRKRLYGIELIAQTQHT